MRVRPVARPVVIADVSEDEDRVTAAGGHYPAWLVRRLHVPVFAVGHHLQVRGLGHGCRLRDRDGKRRAASGKYEQASCYHASPVPHQQIVPPSPIAWPSPPS
jgi:hypothetical protein